MYRRLKVISPLDSKPDSFIKSLSRTNRATAMRRAKRSQKRRGFVSVTVNPSVQKVQVALSELELALLSIAHNEIKKIAGKSFVTIKKRSGPEGGIESQTLSKSWRMLLLKRAEMLASYHRPGKEARVGGRVGVLLFGYGIYTKNDKFLKKIKTKAGETDLLEILEYGSRPHVIGPRKRNGRLYFYWENASPSLPVVGQKIFRGFYNQKVRHPGTRPYGFTRIAVAEAAGLMLSLFYRMRRAKFLLGR